MMQASSKGMEILPTDDPAQTHAALLGYSMPLQIKMLESVLEVDGYLEGIEKLYQAWVKGDDQGAVDAFNLDLARLGDKALAAEYVDAWLTRRNIRMADCAEAYMAEGKQVFFVVGALHLLGEDSVIRELISRGYAAERIV